MMTQGKDAAVALDGTPRKYITFSFDDGITQDARIVALFKKHGLYGCTFFINSGLGGANWAWVGEQFGRPDVPHRRYTDEELTSDIYDGFDMECHTVSHPCLRDLPIEKVIAEVQGDVQRLAALTGTHPIGMAWPGGDPAYTDENVRWVYEYTDIRFARGTTSTHGFALPTQFLTWMPSCSIVETLSGMPAEGLLDTYLNAECTEDMLLYIWGHGYEIDIFGGEGGAWAHLDEMLGKIAAVASRDDRIVSVSNAEFYRLFKDKIPAYIPASCDAAYDGQRK